MLDAGRRRFQNRLLAEADLRRVETTQWSRILRAASGDHGEARLALALLCEAYWYPAYAYVRAQGYSAADAEDLTQGYFARFIEKGVVREVRPEHGRFRSFLFVSVRNFLSNERDRERALKRGGGRRLVSLDAEAAEQRLAAHLRDPETPESLFEKSWALTVVARAHERLERDETRRGGGGRAARLRSFMMGEGPEGGYAAIAKEWGVKESAVRVALHRQRRRFRDILREEIAQTVAASRQIDAEIRHLFGVLGV